MAFYRRFKKHKIALLSLFTLLLLVIFSLSAPLLSSITGYSYKDINLRNRFLPPSKTHLLGTDDIGRDLLILLSYGGRISLSVAFFTAIGSVILGTAIGSISGFYGGIIDSFLMRFTDVMLCLPLLPLMIIMASIDIINLFHLNFLKSFVDPNILKLIIIIILFSWMTVARLVRGTILSLKEKEFIESARAIGASNISIIFKHLLPNSMAPIIVAGTLEVGGVILYEAVLSFLGLGIQPPTVSWGNILQRAYEHLITGKAPWLIITPGIFIFITVISFNFIGDALRDSLDPKLK